MISENDEKKLMEKKQEFFEFGQNIGEVISKIISFLLRKVVIGGAIVALGIIFICWGIFTKKDK